MPQKQFTQTLPMRPGVGLSLCSALIASISSSRTSVGFMGGELNLRSFT